MTRLLVECTHVFRHPKVNSGIQRVVRNVIKQLPTRAEGVECLPVVVINGQLYRVLQLAPLDTPFWNSLETFGERLERLAHRFWQGISAAMRYALRNWRGCCCMWAIG